MKKISSNEERDAYAMGMDVMWRAFRYAAYDENMDLKTALKRYGVWIDEVLSPWVRGDIETIGHDKYNELILPPGVEKLRDNGSENL